jgi:hypothetical protein
MLAAESTDFGTAVAAAEADGLEVAASADFALEPLLQLVSSSAGTISSAAASRRTGGP